MTPAKKPLTARRVDALNLIAAARPFADVVKYARENGNTPLQAAEEAYEWMKGIAAEVAGKPRRTRT